MPTPEGKPTGVDIILAKAKLIAEARKAAGGVLDFRRDGVGHPFGEYDDSGQGFNLMSETATRFRNHVEDALAAFEAEVMAWEPRESWDGSVLLSK